MNGSRAGWIKSCNQAQCCAFAASTRPDKSEALIVCNGHAQIFNNPLIADFSPDLSKFECHPFTAPVVKPETIGFWKTITKITSGIEPRTVAAA